MITCIGLVIVGLFIFGVGIAELPNPKHPDYKNLNQEIRKKKEMRGSIFASLGVLFILVSLFSYPLLNIYESKMNAIANSYESKCKMN